MATSTPEGKQGIFSRLVVLKATAIKSSNCLFRTAHSPRQAESSGDAYSRGSSRFPRRLFIYYIAIRHQVSPEFAKCSCKYVPMSFTAKSPPARGLKVVRVMGADFSGFTMCVCVFSSNSFWTSSSLDVPAGVTQEEGHTGFLIHLLSAVRALIFLARRIKPFLSLVDREVEFVY